MLCQDLLNLNWEPSNHGQGLALRTNLGLRLQLKPQSLHWHNKERPEISKQQNMAIATAAMQINICYKAFE